ncbi:MAG: hypothetical protein HY361_04750 [Candidatus Aenigmarchaeota archaeon]|nr:hypothetical protein [Candidatus Aenigmarchaeota archaeon]
MVSGKTLCGVVRKEFSSIIKTLNEIELAYLAPHRNTTRKRARLTGLNLAMQGSVQIRGIVQQLQTGSVLDFPAAIYLNELNSLRQEAVYVIEMYSEVPDAIRSWTNFYEKSKSVYSRVRKAVKISDLVGVAVCLGAAYNLNENGYSITAELISASILYSLDFLRTKGKINSLARVGAITTASLPALGALASYLTSDSSSWQAVKDLSLTSAGLIAFVHGPAAVYVNSKLNVKDYLEGSRLASAPNVPRDFFERTRKLSYTLSEVIKLKRVVGTSNNTPDYLLKNFEGACVDYLHGTAKKENIRLARIKIREYHSSKARTQSVQTADPDDSVNLVAEQSHSLVTALTAKLSSKSEHDLESRTLETKEVRASAGDLKVYILAIEYGMNQDLAIKLSHQTSYNNTVGIVERLKTILGSDHRYLIAANSSLLSMDRAKSEAYFRNLSAVLGRIAEYGKRVPQNFIVSNNPLAFSSLDGLASLNREMDMLSENPIKTSDPIESKYSGVLREAGYDNFELLRALLVHGFRLESSRPRVGMAYSRFTHIKRATRPAVGQEQMAYFDDVFGQLISDGVILLDKTYKSGGGGGRFPGCYSINPRIESISSPELREFVADCIYSRIRNGKGNGK